MSRGGPPRPEPMPRSKSFACSFSFSFLLVWLSEPAHTVERHFLRGRLTPQYDYLMDGPLSGEGKSVTRLLQDWRGGDSQALDRLLPVVYESLHKIASRCLRSERPGNTLSSTALIHEAYLRLVDADVDWNDRVHFYAVSARVMRRILIDHAKEQGRAKRGGGGGKVAVDEAVMVGAEAPEALLELDTALSRLADRDPRKSEIV